MHLAEIKQRIIAETEKNSEYIIDIGRQVLNNPELGYFEEKTSKLVRDVFDKVGICFEYPFALTGVKGKISGKKEGPTVAIIGEMDALKCSGHPNADGESVAHACGHNAQIAAMLGAAISLKKVATELCGSIVFFAVPAEEFIEIENRAQLKSQGKIEYFGGKQQLIAEGAFDDVDIAIMIHAQPNEKEPKVFVRGYNLGFKVKKITFKGKAAHGSKPHEGTNALNAAALSILGIHSNRETFKDEERIRIHPIITKGGDVVNSVPDEVCIETYVRGANLEAINKGDAAVNRSIDGAAQIIGATVQTDDMPGYLPINENTELSKVFEDIAVEILGEDKVVYGEEITGSTDMGDLSYIIPSIQPSIGGFEGNLHGKDFKVYSEDTAYILSAKLLALTAADLLYDDAKKAKNIIKSFETNFTKNDYLKYIQGE